MLLTANLRFGLKLRRSRKPIEAPNSRLPVYISAAIETPCLFGLIRPAIYMTPDAAANEKQLSHVIAHESAHFRHGDHVFALLRCVCTILHWYNPLVWIAAMLSSRDSELACDEAAIKALGEDARSEYGKTLIALTCEKAAKGKLLIAATSLIGGKRGLRERITDIAKKPKTKLIALIAVLLAAAAAIICTFTGRKDAGRGTDPTDETKEYTYRISMERAPVNWSPMGWQIADESRMMSFLQMPLIDVSLAPDGTGFEWIYEMAAGLEDVTATYADREKWLEPDENGTLPTEGYIYRIDLNPAAKWEDGTPITAADYVYSMNKMIEAAGADYRTSSGASGGVTDIKENGLVADGDHTLYYIAGEQVGEFDMKCRLCGNWIVPEGLYEECEASGGYGTSPENYMSCGPYKIESFDRTGGRIVLVRNENWYGWTDGRHEGQYQTTRIVISIMDHADALEAFGRGELDWIELSGDEISEFRSSEYLMKTESTSVCRFVFATDLEKLNLLEQEAGGGMNLRVLHYDDFRKAISLSIDRAAFCSECTAGFKPAYFLLNDPYYTDIWHSAVPYRNTPEGREAVLRAYGVEYGPGKRYSDAEEAYAAFTGYDAEKARKLFRLVYEQAAADGNYEDGQRIFIRCAVTSAELTDEDVSQQEMLNDFIAEATKGTGFEGKIFISFIGNYEQRQRDVARGGIEMIRTAWGGAAFYPASVIRFYCDPDYMGGLEAIQESCGWDPGTETLTIGIGGAQIRKTLRDWAKSINEGGEYADDPQALLIILGRLESAIIESYQCIPVGSYTDCALRSAKIAFPTEDYNLMCGFGGIRMMRYNYSDAEWKAHGGQQADTPEPSPTPAPTPEPTLIPKPILPPKPTPTSEPPTPTPIPLTDEAKDALAEKAWQTARYANDYGFDLDPGSWDFKQESEWNTEFVRITFSSERGEVWCWLRLRDGEWTPAGNEIFPSQTEWPDEYERIFGDMLNRPRRELIERSVAEFHPWYDENGEQGLNFQSVTPEELAAAGYALTGDAETDYLLVSRYAADQHATQYVNCSEDNVFRCYEAGGYDPKLNYIPFIPEGTMWSYAESVVNFAYRPVNPCIFINDRVDIGCRIWDDSHPEYKGMVGFTLKCAIKKNTDGSYNYAFNCGSGGYTPAFMQMSWFEGTTGFVEAHTRKWIEAEEPDGATEARWWIMPQLFGVDWEQFEADLGEQTFYWLMQEIEPYSVTDSETPDMQTLYDMWAIKGALYAEGKYREGFARILIRQAEGDAESFAKALSQLEPGEKEIILRLIGR